MTPTRAVFFTVGTHPINGSDALKTSTAVLHRVALLAPYASLSAAAFIATDSALAFVQSVQVVAL